MKAVLGPLFQYFLPKIQIAATQKYHYHCEKKYYKSAVVLSVEVGMNLIF